MMMWPPRKKASGIVSPGGGRFIGLSVEGRQPILIKPSHSLTIASNGAGKTTNIALPALMDLASCHPEKAILVFDGKGSEISAQTAAMFANTGRPVRLVDDFDTRPELAHLKIELNPFSSVVESHRRDPRDDVFASQNMTHALLHEPDNDARNKYWRNWPRLLADFSNGLMLARKSENATPGAASLILSDLDMLVSMAQIEAVEGAPRLKAQATTIVGMQHHEHFAQHVEAAQNMLEIWGPGSRLAETGANSVHSHESLIREGAIIYLCGPQAIMPRLANYYALHIQSFISALYNGAGALRAICDEFSNMPLKSLVESLTTVRAFGGEFHMIAQSRSEILRKYGEHETATIEDNSILKTWLGFANFEEAERVSKAMGDEFAISTALGSDNSGLKTNENLSQIKQRRMSAAELMAMPKGEMLCHYKGLGFFRAYTLGQNQRAPYCHLLADNPLEGGRLPPDPLITLPMPQLGETT